MNYLNPRIVCAAMRMDDGKIIVGVRHFSPEMRETLARIYGKGIKLFGFFIRKPYHLRVAEQGFIDQFGKFHSRSAAWEIADKNGQIIRPTGFEKNPSPRKSNIGDKELLFSENLY